MTHAKLLLTTLALLLLAGGLGAAALAGESDPAPVEPFVVAPSRVGDVVTFATFERNETTGDWEEAGSQTFRIEELRRTLGTGSRAFETAVVSYNRTNGASSFSMDTAGGVGEVPTTTYEYVDLASRRVVRTEVKTAGDDVALGFTDDRPAALDVLGFQGALFAPGTDMATRAPTDVSFSSYGGAFLGFDWGTPLGGSSTAVLPLVFDFSLGEGRGVTSAVLEEGTVDGRDVLGVVTKYHIMLPDEMRSEEAAGRIDIARTDFFAAGTPYPLATRMKYVVHTSEGAYEGEELTSLAAFEPGDGVAVPWAGAPAAHPLPPAELRRAEERAGLRSGADSTMPYPLDLALRDVDEAPTLVPFHLWREEHPYAALVSAVHARGTTSAPAAEVYQWDLEFAAADGTTFSVSAQRAPGAPTAQTTGGLRPGTIEDFDPARLPERPVLVADVETAWKIGASDTYADAPPNYLVWGLAHGSVSASLLCVSPETTPFATADQDPFSYVLLGHTTVGQCPVSETNQRTSAVLFDVVNGTQLWSFEIRRDLDRGILGGGETEPAIAAASTTAPFAMPAIATGLIAAGGLLVALIVVYLLPAIKYAVAKWFFFLGGFSRIAESEVLEHKVRQGIVDHVGAEPGIHLGALHKRLGVGWGTLVYHVAVLERHKLVSSLTEGRNRRFFPVGSFDWGERDQVAVLRHDKTREAYDIVIARPDVATGTVAGALGMTLAGAMWHLKRLEDAALVRREKVGRTVRYRAAPIDVGGAAARMEKPAR